MYTSTERWVLSLASKGHVYHAKGHAFVPHRGHVDREVENLGDLLELQPHQPGDSRGTTYYQRYTLTPAGWAVYHQFAAADA